MTDLRVAFAGDRAVAVEILEYLLVENVRPVAVCVSGPATASHDEELLQRCTHLRGDAISRGREFRSPRFVDVLRAEQVDLFLSVHFPYIVPPEVLAVPTMASLNLHPSFLPYNRGWHTVTWALLEDTPVGATLHVMDDGLDTGPIVHQRRLDIRPHDTAAEIYPRLARLEVQVFKEAWPDIAGRLLYTREQDPAIATSHSRADLSDDVRRLDLGVPQTARALLTRLRALTTSRHEEAAYFEEGGMRYLVQVKLAEADA